MDRKTLQTSKTACSVVCLAPPARLELTTFRLGGGPSIPVRYGGRSCTSFCGRFFDGHFILAYAGAFVNRGLTRRGKLSILYIYHMNSEREHHEPDPK